MSAWVRHYAKIDARSLGLFRVLMGIVLLGDLRYRFRWLADFYSNDGVLPNHNHLFNLKNEGRFVWSALHAFNTPGEATVGFAVIALFYALFTLGYQTRLFHALSLLSLVSLTARNLLAEGPGEAVAIALMSVTLLLPLGSRLSLDAALATSRGAWETKPRQLLDRGALPDAARVRAARLPGWAPTSLAGALPLALIAVIFLSLARAQSGDAWRDGSALGKALHVFMIASPLGFSVRDAGLLTFLTHLLFAAQWAIPILIVAPVLRGLTRGVAALLMACHGLVYATLTSFTLFGWAIFAGAALLVANDTWSTWAERHDKRAVRTVIFDGDCGICFWLSKVLRRLDTRRHLVFQSNDAVLPRDEPEGDEGDAPELLLVWDDAKRDLVKRKTPDGITAELLDQTVVAVRPDGTFATRGEAVCEVLRAIPGGGPIATLLAAPLVRSLRDLLYVAVAVRRARISTELGFAACGVPLPGEADAPLATPEISPVRKARQRVTATAREALALVLGFALLAKASETSPLGLKLPHSALADSITWWSRNTTRWTLLAPQPAAEKGGLIVDAVSKEGVAVDPLTGQPPVASLERPFPLGAMWATYLDRIQRDDYRPYQNAFKTYVSKGGPLWAGTEPNKRLVGIDAYWITVPTLGPAPEPPKARRLFRQGRGGEKLTTLSADIASSPVAEPARGLPTLLRPEPGLDDDAPPPPPPPENDFSPGLQ